MALYQWLAEWSRWLWPALAPHLWLSMLFALAAWLAAILLKRAPARWRYPKLPARKPETQDRTRRLAVEGKDYFFFFSFFCPFAFVNTFNARSVIAKSRE